MNEVNFAAGVQVDIIEEQINLSKIKAKIFAAQLLILVTSTGVFGQTSASFSFGLFWHVAHFPLMY